MTLRAVFALALGALTTAVQAQTWRDPQTRVAGGLHDSPTTEMRTIQARFGQCVVLHHHAEASRFVLEFPSSTESDTLFKALASVLGDSDCMTIAISGTGVVGMRFPGDAMRYALADALVQADFAGASLTDLDRVAPLVQIPFDEAQFQPKPSDNLQRIKALAKFREYQVSQIYLAVFGECVVRIKPNEAAAVLRAAPASIAEQAALTILTPFLGYCIQDGRTLALNKTVVRGTLASNYYRLAKAPRLPAPPIAGGH